ncbi:Ion transport protein-domain-containing protein [Pelagophyceae sp. CCMP2097]|nr:Ion transport protein-domain-containing protein [Pelagophyceae sp. CCMP2097]
MDALGPVVVVYFVLLILIGSFFAVNLIVAVIYQAYVSIEATEAPVRLADALTRFDDDAADAAAAAAEVQSRRSRGPPARDRGARQDRDAALARVASPARRFVLRWWWRLRDFCHGVADSDAFSAFYTCCIAVNTLVLMAEHKSQARAQSLFTCRANVLLTYLFIGEMLVKMLGTDYVFDAEDGGFNTFDAIITVGSVVDIIASQGVSGRGCDRVRVDVRRGEGGGDSAALQALRVGRVLRLVRILRSLRIVRAWKSMSHILSAVVRSGPALFNFSCLLVMFSWVYALAGMQMYAGRFVGSAGRKAVRPRTNFDSLDGALITVFVVVSGENWDEVLDLAYRANGAVGLFFVTSMYWLGNFVVLNMFLAILLSNFDTAVGGSETLYDQLEQSNEVTNVLKASLRACDHAATSAGLRMASTPRLGRCAGRARRLAADALAAVARPAARCAQVLRAAAGGGAAKRVRDASARILNTSTRVLDVSARAGGGPAARAGDDEQQRAFNAAVDAATQEIAGQMQSELRTSMCRRGRREYFDCFSGSVAVDWLLEAAFAVDTAGAEALGQKLLDKRLISKAEGSAKRTFRNLVARARRTQLAAQHASAAQRAAAARRASGSPESPTPRRLFPSARSFTTPRGSPALGSPPWDRPGGSPLAVPETPPPWPPPPPGVFDEDRFADDHQLYRFCARHAHRLHLVGDPETMKIQRAARDVRQRFARRRRLLGSGASLGLFSADSAVRRACVALVIHPAFDATVGLLIVVSSILLAAESPDQNESTAAFAHADIALTLCFNVEFIVKSVASGFFVYLSSGWNTLDFAIVMVSNASIALAGADLSYLKALRALRALRPLRMIQRYPAMKTVVDALMEALPDLLNVGLVVLGFFCIFSVAGGTLFRGSLDWCHVGPKNSNECARAGCDYAAVDDDDWAYAEHFGRYEVGKKQCRAWWRSRGEAGGGVPWSALPAEFVSEGALGSSPLRAEWKAMLPNYDNLGQGLLALFEVATLEGWPSIMYAAMDVTVDPERHPRRNASPAHAVFYVIFVVIGSFFVMNMFVGVVVHKFQLSKERTDGANIMVTDGQRAFVGKIKALLDTGRPSRLRLPNEPWRRKLFYLVVSEKFEVCVIAIITLNMVAISLQHYDQSPRWTFVLDTVGNTAFTSLFAAEMALKMLGLGAEQYAADNWNRFDAFIVATSLIDTATSFSGSALLEFNLSLFRILRLVRVIKLVNVNQGLKALLRSLVVSLPSLMNVGSLLLLLIFVYACIGMNLYHRVERAGAVTQHVNFETFGFSMLALFRCLTGEDWWALMQQVVDDANRISAYAFFPSFVVLGNFILLNLCVAVILEAFAEFMQRGGA